MKLLAWLLLKMGYVLVPWRRYENMEYAYYRRNIFMEKLRELNNEEEEL